MLRIAHHTVSPRLVAFDKDGTLIAFRAFWHAWLERNWALIEERVSLTPAAREALAASLGLDLATRAWDPLGPLTLAATREVVVIIASQLYRYAGLDWLAAMALMDEVNRLAYATLPLDTLIQPIGDAADLLARLRAHGLRLALVTADDRAPTEDALRRLDLVDCWDVILCGDDGLPQKPAPEAALEACRRVGVAPNEAIMVGDTIADLVMARRAGYALAVGVTSGALDAATLAPHADAVVDSIHDIVIIDQEDTP